jgi:phytoene/squalene synthetase
MLSSGAQLPVGVASELYKEILLKIIENDYDNFNKRAYVSKVAADSPEFRV